MLEMEDNKECLPTLACIFFYRIVDRSLPCVLEYFFFKLMRYCIGGGGIITFSFCDTLSLFVLSGAETMVSQTFCCQICIYSIYIISKTGID